MTDIDESALLGDDFGSDRFTGDIIDEDELLGLNDDKSQTSVNGNKSASVQNNSTNNDDTEQLDYDEDDETEKKPRDKFSSEKKQESSESANSNNQKGGSKCYVNPKFQNRMPNSSNSNSQGPLPSLLSQSIPPPMQQQMVGTPVDYNVRMVMMNSLRPIAPVNPMMRPMGPPTFQGFPPAMPPMGTQGQGPITAQIGQLSTVIQQQQDGTITFRTTIPQIPTPRVTVARAGCSEPGQNKDWNSMVDEFINGASSRSRKRERRSRSISSRSRSYSNSSYSSSYSGKSYSSRSGSSRSPSPRHRRRRGSPSRKRSNRPSYRHSSYRRYRHDRSKRSPRRRRDSKSDLRNTMECAEAVGLDSDYVRKLDEQKKLREEVARQKYQRDSRNDGPKREARRPSTEASSSSQQRRTDEERNRPRTEAKSTTQSSSSNSNVDNKVKPYLVVVINNLGNLSDAYKRLKMVATAVGPVKKVWQTSDDSVSIIFEHHEHAKNFMLQYHMKQFNGTTLNIGLEKVFLNLQSIP